MSAAVPARDPGLQPERTALAWRRTGLSLIAGALLIARLAMDTLGHSVLVPAAVAVTLGLWVISVTVRKRRYAWHQAGAPLLADLLTDGRVPAVVTVVTASLAVGELASLVAQFLR